VRLAGGDVVRLAGLPFRRRQPVRPHRVAHVHEVAPDLEVSDLDPGRAQPGFDFGDLTGERGDHEAVRLARAAVVEQPQAHGAQAERLEVLEAEHVRGRLADRVRRHRAERLPFPDRQLVLADQAVRLGRARQHHRRVEVELAHGF
jgi:hypothetical protein